MLPSTIYKSKQFFALVIKLFIVIGCLYFIYNKLYHHQQIRFSDFYQKLIENEDFSIKTLLFLLIFSFINWMLEITKWKNLATHVKNISFPSAIKQSLASLTVSLITPNRIGEYGAKAIYFNKEIRIKILGLNLLGNLYQLITTSIFGVFGISYLLLTFNIELPLKPILFLFGICVVLFLIVWIFFKMNISFKGYSIKSLFLFTQKISGKLHFKTAVISILRYIVFVHQFYYLLVVFHVDITYSQALTSIFSMYFIASIIPMLSLLDVVVKSSIAIWVFSFFNSNPTNILSIVLIMWIFNFAFPSILGSYFVLTFKNQNLIATKE